jgi:molybdenum cofactor cytidylyltransferase
MTGRPMVAAVILAAGSSTRMGAVNKLTAPLGKSTVVRHVAEACLASAARLVYVVTGHQAEDVEAALAGLAVRMVYNPAHRQGMSTSLRCGLQSLPAAADAVVVCLGDMPKVSPAVIDALIARFAEARCTGEGPVICTPVSAGRRGNPVLLDRAFFPEIFEIEGDVGARPLIAAHEAQVREVDVPDDAILTDVDTPDQLAAVRAGDDGA